MKVKASSWFVLGVIILLIPFSLKAGGEANGEKRNVVVIRRIDVRPATILRPHDLNEKSTNLVSLRSNFITPIKVPTPEEQAELKKNFLIVSGVRKNTALPNQ